MTVPPERADPPSPPPAGNTGPSRGDAPPRPPAPPGGGNTTAGRWIEAACAELGLSPAEVPVRAVLDLARVAAHEVERPAAPLTAFMVGLAVGRGGDLAEAAARMERLADGWSAAPDNG